MTHCQQAANYQTVACSGTDQAATHAVRSAETILTAACFRHATLYALDRAPASIGPLPEFLRQDEGTALSLKDMRNAYLTALRDAYQDCIRIKAAFLQAADDLRDTAPMLINLARVQRLADEFVQAIDRYEAFNTAAHHAGATPAQIREATQE